MRTDTKTFRNRVLRTLRTAGVRSVVARNVARTIVRDVTFYLEGRDLPPEIGTFDVEIFHADARCQVLTARIDVNGHIVSLGSDRYGRFVTTEPTPRQDAIYEELCAMLPDLYEAVGTAMDDWEAVNGRRPRVDEDWADRSAFARAHPAAVAVQKRYDTLRAESLGINPRIHGGLADPDLAEVYRNCYKSDHGINPRGYATHSEMTAYLRDRQAEDGSNPDPDLEFDLDDFGLAA